MRWIDAVICMYARVYRNVVGNLMTALPQLTELNLLHSTIHAAAGGDVLYGALAGPLPDVIMMPHLQVLKPFAAPNCIFSRLRTPVLQKLLSYEDLYPYEWDVDEKESPVQLLEFLSSCATTLESLTIECPFTITPNSRSDIKRNSNNESSDLDGNAIEDKSTVLPPMLAVRQFSLNCQRFVGDDGSTGQLLAKCCALARIRVATDWQESVGLMSALVSSLPATVTHIKCRVSLTVIRPFVMLLQRLPQLQVMDVSNGNPDNPSNYAGQLVREQANKEIPHMENVKIIC